MTTIAENIQTLRSIKSDIKNAIIQKGGSVTDAFGTYAQAITNLPSGGGGGTEIEDALVARTISVYSNDRVSVVGDYAFATCHNLNTINMQNCSSLGNFGFAYCFNLASVSLPLCEFISDRGFIYCSALAFIDLPLCSYIGSSVFYFCEKISYVKLPLCENIGSYTFQNCYSLKEVYLNSVSRVTTIQVKTFSRCSNLTSIYVPSSLVDAFKTAPYWSSMSTKIVAYTGA